jgi:uncharacterized protein YajQ (UPF0234 family)
MPSFDIVSNADVAEIDNAINGVTREIGNRFDFKGSKCTVEREGDVITILADDDMKLRQMQEMVRGLKLRQMQEMVRGYVTKRGIEVGALDFQTPEKAAGQSLRQKVTIRQGIPTELAKKITKSLKGSKLKIQVAIQGNELRVSGKKRDDLQDAIAHVKEMGLEQPLQYENFRD